MAAGAGPDGTEAVSEFERPAELAVEPSSEPTAPPAAESTAQAEKAEATAQAEKTEATAQAEKTNAGTVPTAATVEPTPPATPATADALMREALVPPKAVEDTSAFVPRPGSPAAEPAVQAARVEAEAARAALALEIGRLRDAGRDAVDIKAKVKGMPAAIAREPAKFLGLGAAGAGAGVLLSRLRRGRKKAMPPGLLPPEVETVLERVGPDADKVREALNAGFTRFLETEGAQAAAPRRKVPGLIPLFILPVASTLAREAIKRLVAGPAKR